MSGTLHDLLFGLGVATQPVNIIAGFAGVITGTIIGVIPALGPTQGAALLLPVVFRLAPHTGLIFLSGLYMGAIFGGSVTSILFNIPEIGTDTITGTLRLMFGTFALLAGIKFLVVVVGAFGIGELLRAAEENIMTKGAVAARISWANVFDALKEMRAYWKTFLRSTISGFWIGVLPGTGATPASFVGYGLAKRFSKHPEKFGTGILEGVVAPESAA